MRTRSIAIMALAVALVALGQQTARSQSGTFSTQRSQSGSFSNPQTPTAAKDAACVIYPLSGMGHDANLAAWLAETIPTVIEPESWRDAATTITFHGPSRVLVVRQTPAVHAKIKAFLADLKTAAREEKGATPLRKAPVMQAQYTDPMPAKSAQHAGAGYPVPAAQTQPKHLFHLILRYEGDGLSDDAVAGLVKQISDAAMVKTDGDAKPKNDSAKGPSLGQLLHFIVRYEGEGIVDANVVALMKALYGANGPSGPTWGNPVRTTAPACTPYGEYGTSSMPPSTAPTPAPSGSAPSTQPGPPYNGSPTPSNTAPSPQPSSTAPSTQAVPSRPHLFNQYSSDPTERMQQMLNQSENLRELQKEWERFWMLDQQPTKTPATLPGSTSPLPAPAVTQPGSNPAQGGTSLPATGAQLPNTR